MGSRTESVWLAASLFPVPVPEIDPLLELLALCTARGCNERKKHCHPHNPARPKSLLTRASLSHSARMATLHSWGIVYLPFRLLTNDISQSRSRL